MRASFNILFGIILCLLVSCKKDHSTLTAVAQPAEDLLNASFSDTSLVFSHSVAYDSIASFNDRYKFLGSNFDPEFGRTDANLYTNVNIPDNITNVNFGDSLVLQSAEMVLAIAGLDYVGDNKTPLTYCVFPVNTALQKSRVYYTNQSAIYDGSVVLGAYTGTLAILNGKTVLKIAMDSIFAAGVISNTAALLNNGAFQAAYKGFYITAASSSLNTGNSQGAIYKYDLDDTSSGFYVYYKNGSNAEVKSFRFTFSGGDAVKFNAVSYQPGLSTNQSLTKQLVDKDSTFGKTNLFLKALGGSRIKLYIPGLNNYAESVPVSVNRAELVLFADLNYSGAPGIYAAPPIISLLPLDDNGKEVFAIDQLTPIDLQRYDGKFDVANNRYVFNIARHVQAILRGQRKNRGFYIVVADPNPIYTARRDSYASRIILAGSSHSSLRPRFSISYIKLLHD